MTEKVPSQPANDYTQSPRRSLRIRKPARPPQHFDSEIDKLPSAGSKRTKRVTSNSKKATKRKKSEDEKVQRKSESNDDDPDFNIDTEIRESSPDNHQRNTHKTSTVPDSAQCENVASSEECSWGYLSDPQQLKIVTWNVSSCRTVIKNGSLMRYMDKEAPDILCLQETKMTEKAVEDFPDVDEYEVYWNHSEKKGYSGVAILIRSDLSEKKKVVVERIEPGMGLPEADREGRVLTCYLSTGHALVNAYVPNSGGQLARLDFRTGTFEPAMRKFLNGLCEKNRVLYCGDLNVAHMEIDIHNSKGNQKSAGHTPQERQEFTNFLGSGNGWIDSFRELYPGVPGYTYYSRRFGPRLKNEGKGWRLDYHVLDSKSFANGVVDDVHIRAHVDGSDHYPLVLMYRITGNTGDTTTH